QTFQHSNTFWSNGNIYQAFISERRLFGCKFFYNQPVYNTACIAHFIQHSFSDLKGGNGFGIRASEYAENIELLRCDILLVEKIFLPLHNPVTGIYQVNNALLVLISERRLVNIVF